MTYWTLELVTFPTSKFELESDYEFHAEVTESGLRKLEQKEQGKGTADMKPGVDYVVKRDVPTCEGWIPFEDNEHTRDYRHTWVLARRNRP
eukprot:594138-Karenia_brevis.AAC.1